MESAPSFVWGRTPTGGWYPVLVDTSGHVKVDALSVANPSNLDLALSNFTPLSKGYLRNTALPAADHDLLNSSITPTNSPSYLLVYVCISVTGKLYITRKVGGTTWAEYLNSGVGLLAEAAYLFSVAWRSGDTINLRYNATTGTLLCLDVSEVLL